MTVPFPLSTTDSGQQPLSPDEYRRRLAEAQAWQNAETPDDPQAEVPNPGTPRQEGYRRVVSFVRSLRPKDVGAAVARGTMKAVDETSNTVLSVGKEIAKRTGLGEAVSGEDFLTWYSQKTGEVNPFTFGADRRERWLGPDSNGALGFVEGAAQFVAGMAGATRILKVGQVAGAVRTARIAAAGAAVDMTAFDPYQQRLSNLIESGPPRVQNALTRFLAANDEDNEATARLKAGLEGLLVGATVDRFIAGVRALRTARKASDGRLNSQKARDSIAADLEQATSATVADDAVTIRRNSNGTYNLLANATDAELDEAIAPRFASEAEAQTVAASINRAQRQEAALRGKLSLEQIEQVTTVAARITKGADPADVQRLLDGTDFNFSYVQTADEAKAVIEAMSEVLPRTRTVQSHAETVRLAQDVLSDMDGASAVEAIGKAFNNTEKLPQLITASRTYLYDLGKRIADLSFAADTNADNPVAIDQLARSLDHLYAIHDKLAGTTTNVARTLNAHQIPVGGKIQTPSKAPGKSHFAPATHRSTAGLSAREVRSLARQVRLAEGDPKAILAAVKSAQAATDGEAGSGIFDRIISYRVEALLSGPKTQIVNAVSNAANAFITPTEYWWAGLRSGNSALQQEGADILTGVFLNFRDSWKAAGKALRAGANLLDPSASVSDMTTPAPMGTSWLSKLLHVPSRFLLTTDEFFKQLNYRSVVRAKSLRLAREDGITDRALLGQRVTDDLAAAFSLNGAAANDVALAYTRSATFTDPLEYGFGLTLQKAAQEHRLVRLVVPFVRTPTNLYRWVAKHTPALNRFQRQHAEDIAAGGERAAVAHARTEMGMAIYGTAALFALSGNITGAGPSNRALRQQWKEAGNQPYSIRLPNGQWIAYNRGDPFTAPFGLVADAVAISGEMGDEDGEALAAAIMASVASNLSSKTYLQGITEAMSALSSGNGWEWEKLTNNLATSFIPNLFRQVNPDDTLRESRSLLDQAMSRLPGFSEQLEPRRNILGEPVLRPPGWANNALNPFTLSRKVENVSVQDELLRLGRSLAMPAEKLAEGRIDLTDRKAFDNATGQSPYDRMLELVADPGDGKRSLRTDMEKLVQSKRWQDASDGTSIMPGGMRYLLASRLITAHQERAFGRVLKEYPLLKDAMKLDERTKAAAITGGDDAVARVEALFGQ